MAAVVCSCSDISVRIESRALANLISQSPERFIIVAVDNDPAAFSAQAGSTPRDYEAMTATFGRGPFTISQGPSSRCGLTARLRHIRALLNWG
jgi:hypothetical protein